MQRCKKLSNVFYSAELHTGKTMLKPNREFTCFFIVEHEESEEYIHSQSLQLFMSQCYGFHFCGSYSKRWVEAMRQVFRQVKRYDSTIESTMIRHYENWDTFAEELDSELYCRPFIPRDVYLVYDDAEIFNRVLKRLTHHIDK